MIDGVVIKPLRRIPDERGYIMHMLRADDPDFEKFGEIYFSTVYPGVVKAWHLHQEMILNYAVPFGMIKLVLYDERENSPTRGEVQEIFMGEQNYQLVKIPPHVWNGFKGVGPETAILANCASIPHDPNEMIRREADDPSVPYDWALKHG